MIPRVPEDAFIALLRRVYHNGRHCSGSHRVNGRGLSSLRMVVTRPSPPTPTLTSSPAPSSTDQNNRTLLRAPTNHHNNLTAKRHASTTTRRNTTKPTSNDPRKKTAGKSQRPPPPPKKQGQGQEQKKPKQIAVLGGGITGLTTAHYLARYAGPDVHVTLYEASDRLGGWIDSIPVTAANGSKGDDVLLQQGPRMLRTGAKSHRYDDLVLYDVIASLKLQDEIRHPTGPNNRYIFYPDHLVKLPSTAWEGARRLLWDQFWTLEPEPLWEGCVYMAICYYIHNAGTKADFMHAAITAGATDQAALLAAHARAITEAGHNGDESVGAFLTRAFGSPPLESESEDPDDRPPLASRAPPVNNLVSAMLHGIYGGDVWRLSARHTILDRLWFNTIAPRPRGQTWMPRKDLYLLYELMDGGEGINDNAAEIVRLAEGAVKDGWNVLAFEDGLGTLVRGLVQDLENRPNVTICRGEPVTSLAYENDHVIVKTTKSAENKPAQSQYDHVISTIFSKHLAGLAKQDNVPLLPALAETHAVTIMVVNLWYPGRDLLENNHGFGYLIPNSTPDNDEGALGVLFDSDLDPTDPAANPNFDAATRSGSPLPPPGTKLTVMLGGHHWDGWTHLPNEEAGVAMAKSTLSKHLGIDPDEPVQARAKLCRDCLPQHFVGHRERMEAAHFQLADAFEGRLSVAGPSYTTVGVVPAMRAGWEAAMRVARPKRTGMWVDNSDGEAEAKARAEVEARGELAYLIEKKNREQDQNYPSANARHRNGNGPNSHSLAAPDWLAGATRPRRRDGRPFDTAGDWLRWWIRRASAGPVGLSSASLCFTARTEFSTEENEQMMAELRMREIMEDREKKTRTTGMGTGTGEKQKQGRAGAGAGAGAAFLPPILLRHTGLEEFAVLEIKTLAPVRKDELPFRTWTKDSLRLEVRDDVPVEEEGGSGSTEVVQLIRRRGEDWEQAPFVTVTHLDMDGKPVRGEKNPDFARRVTVVPPSNVYNQRI